MDTGKGAVWINESASFAGGREKDPVAVFSNQTMHAFSCFTQPCFRLLLKHASNYLEKCTDSVVSSSGALKDQWD